MDVTSSSFIITPRSSGGSRKRGENRASDDESTMTGGEVDAIRNPTHLFQRINSGDWEGALVAISERPADASVWVSRNDAKISWKYLPLHLICLQKRPPLTLLRELLQVYPHAASLSTPHDGNLPIHYACESGCDSSQLLFDILSALLDVFPQSLESKNSKGRTPLLLCSAKTRKVMMNVMRSRKQPNSGDRGSTISTLHDRDGASVPSGIINQCEHRNEGAESSSRDKFLSREIRHPPPVDVLPPLIDAIESSDFDEATEESMWTKTSRHRPNPSPINTASKHQMNQLSRLEPQQIEALIKQTRSQQQIIDQLNERLLQSTPKTRCEDAVAEDAKMLCQRILEKAEADGVKFRTRIKQLEDSNAEITQRSSMREDELAKTLTGIADVLVKKSTELKLVLGDDASSLYNFSERGNSQILVDAFTQLFAFCESENEKLRCNVRSTEEQLSACEIKEKALLSANLNFRQEKEVFVKSQRDLEKLVSDLQEDKHALEQSLVDKKDKISTLTVTINSLQEQVASMSAQHSQEHEDIFISENYQLRFQLNQMKAQSDQSSQTQALTNFQQKMAENEKQIESLLKGQELLKQKNKSLKDAILMNNEKYLNKVQELGEKYSELEKVNADLRQRINKSNARERSSLRVSLEGEDKLLYEV